jgi:prepilin-type N-terminal cleavage/methylation domain-containing protein
MSMTPSGPRARGALRRRHSLRVAGFEAGFSLIETIAALVIFSILTLGLLPLLTASIRGSNTARADTIGKNAALKAMERVRGLPFYISYASSTAKVDVLDLYFPNYTGANKTSLTDIYYETVCPVTPTNPACPVDIPSGYTLTFDARFVDAVASGTQPSPGETLTSYSTVAPASTYAWNSASTDNPPRQQLRMDVIASWVQGGKTKTFKISSILSDRDFGGLKVNGSASLGYSIQFHAQYDTKKNVGGGTGVESQLTMLGPNGESAIEGRRLSTARQVTDAGAVSLTRYTSGSTGADLTGSPATAATTPTLLAPPDAAFADATAAQVSVGHADFSSALTAGFGPTSVTGIQAAASSLAPAAAGNAAVTAVTSGTTDYMWVKDPQLNNTDYNTFTLVNGGPIFSVVRDNGLPAPILSSPATTGQTLVGGTSTQTLSSSVHTQATTGFDRMLFLKTANYIPTTNAPVSTGGTLSASGAVIVIDNFQAAVSCDSNTNGTGSASASYSGTLYYWADTINGTGGSSLGITGGAYVPINFNVTASSTGTDPLAAVKAMNGGLGPLVFDGNKTAKDIYLFSTDGYLDDWDSVPATTATTTARTDASGAAYTSTTASIDSAISITTSDFDTTKQIETKLSTSVGTLSCLAEDLR